MPTKLEVINNVLALIGEQPLLTSSGRLGLLATNAINTSIINVAQETRANVFESTFSLNVTSPDYLTPVSLPSNIQQVFDVAVRASTGNSQGDTLVPLEYARKDQLTYHPSYSILGQEFFLSPHLLRPVTLNLRVLSVSELPALDSTQVDLPSNVLSVVAHGAAAILATSYLDDPNLASLQRNLASQLGDKLRTQAGTSRGRTFNMGKKLASATFASSGISSLPGSSVQYAPLDSPDFLGTPKIVGNLIATQPFVTAALVPFLLSSTAASTYLTLTGAASTYATIASLASKANLASPALTGTPTAPTAANGTSTTQLATTAFVQQSNRPVFSVLKDASAQTLTTVGSSVDVTWTTELVDTNSAFSSTAFTVPAGLAGTYVFDLTLYLGTAGSTTASTVRFNVNGVAVRRLGEETLAIGQASIVSASWIIPLSVGDVCTVNVRLSSGGSTVIGFATTNAPEILSSFSGYRLAG